METTQIVIIKKSFRIVSTILFYAVILLMLLFTIANLKVKQTSDIANVFGSGFHSIEKEYSLNSQNNSLVSKDIVLVKMVDEEIISELKIGDIVTYFDEERHQLVTHKIVEIDTQDDVLYFTTQSQSSVSISKSIEAKNVLGVYQSSINGLGSFLDYLQSPEGFIVLVVFPVFVMMIFESVHLYNNLLNYNKLKSEARVQKTYKKILKNLENETSRIRHQIMSNWITEIDYEKIVKLRM
ncbi:MAG: hypothetical protein K9L02_05400 [Acholeplasmataceae bacterium]|nr:hypothetical protein [Acholeplasmataceae bacterium]